MPTTTKLTIRSLLKHHNGKIGFTWLMVALENMLIVLLPLFVGFTIDGLLKNELTHLTILAFLLTLLVVISVVRGLYDTRAYGAIRIEVGESVVNQMQHQKLSIRNARLDMSREFVDFLENDIPPLLTAVIQICASIIILTSFHISLGISAVIASSIMLVVYGSFHQYFIRLNASLNNQFERQVSVLSRVPFLGVRRHLERINRREILISDAEAIVYGLIFFALFGFVIANLWLSTNVTQPTAGEIFSIVTYSLEFVEAAILLPITLQALSRLTEISRRLNRQDISNDFNVSKVIE